MKGHLTLTLHLTTAGAGMYWGGYLVLTGIYGIPFSAWYLVVLIGGVVLGVGAILQHVLKKLWTAWCVVLGSSLLSAYFFSALVYNIRDFTASSAAMTSERVLALASVVLTATSLFFAVRGVQHPTKECPFRPVP